MRRRRIDQRTHLGQHGGGVRPHAAPQREALGRLLDQHAQAVARGGAVRARPVQEGLGGADKTKGVDADIVDDTNAKINLDVIMEYGKSAPEIFDDIKKVVGGDLKDMTGLNVVEMTVNVVDVMTPEEYAQKNGSNSDDGQQDDSAN